MFKIAKSFEFAASHVLSGLPIDHQCGRLHGHNYVVDVELSAEFLDSTGFVLDYGELKPVKAWIDSTLDHRHLNEVMGELQPSAEILAKWIHAEVVEILCLEHGHEPRGPFGAGLWWVSAVRVHETSKTVAEYFPFA